MISPPVTALATRYLRRRSTHSRQAGQHSTRALLVVVAAAVATSSPPTRPPAPVRVCLLWCECGEFPLPTLTLQTSSLSPRSLSICSSSHCCCCWWCSRVHAAAGIIVCRPYSPESAFSLCPPLSHAHNTKKETLLNQETEGVMIERGSPTPSSPVSSSNCCFSSGGRGRCSGRRSGSGPGPRGRCNGHRLLFVRWSGKTHHPVSTSLYHAHACIC